MTREQIKKQVAKLAKNVELTTGAEDLHIELCEDGILVDHIGTKNDNVINYFKGMTLTEFEYDEICNCSYYSYAR